MRTFPGNMGKSCFLQSVIFKLDQLPNPARQAAAWTLFGIRAVGQKQASSRRQGEELGATAVPPLFKGILHFKANQPLNSKSSLDITTCWLVSLAQAGGNLELGMSIMAKEEKSLQLLQSWVHAQSWEVWKEGSHTLVTQPPAPLGCPCHELTREWKLKRKLIFKRSRTQELN